MEYIVHLSLKLTEKSYNLFTLELILFICCHQVQN